MKKLISFEDFKKSKIVKENIDEIIPEGLPEENFIDDENEGLDRIKGYLDDENMNSIIDEDILDQVVNYLREALLEMEQQGFVDENFTDELDDRHDGDWKSWILEVIELPDFPEEGIIGVLEILDEVPYSEENDVQCPDCEGTGVDEDGEECERCEGDGRVNRPYDIPPDND